MYVFSLFVDINLEHLHRRLIIHNSYDIFSWSYNLFLCQNFELIVFLMLNLVKSLCKNVKHTGYDWKGKTLSTLYVNYYFQITRWIEFYQYCYRFRQFNLTIVIVFLRYGQMVMNFFTVDRLIPDILYKI